MLDAVLRSLQRHEAVLRQDLDRQRAALQEALEARLERLQDELLLRLARGGGGAAERGAAATDMLPGNSVQEHTSLSSVGKAGSNGTPVPKRPSGGPGLRSCSDISAGAASVGEAASSSLASARLPRAARSTSRCYLSARLQDFVASTVFDLLSTVIVLVNVVVMFVSLELEGYEAALALKLRSDDGSAWLGAESAFGIAEHVFAAWFTLELLLRYWVFGRRMFDTPAAVLDALVVIATLVDLYVLQQLAHQDVMNLSFGRLVRLIKLVKLLRTFRAAAVFSELRILIQTVASSLRALVWSMVLLGIILVACGMLMAQLLLGFIQERTASDDLRLWAYTYYGGAVRATYTMFEATLSGCWPNYARRLIDEVSPWYALFWIFYVVLIGFAVIRVMGALFLSATLRAAGDDADMMVLRRLKDKEKYARRLRAFFTEADVSHDGRLDRQELERVIQDPLCQTRLHALELETYEVSALFDILDDNGGGLAFEAFMQGAQRIKGTARAVDSIRIMHQQEQLRTSISDIEQKLEGLASLVPAPADAAATQHAD